MYALCTCIKMKLSALKFGTNNNIQRPWQLHQCKELYKISQVIYYYCLYQYRCKCIFFSCVKTSHRWLKNNLMPWLLKQRKIWKCVTSSIYSNKRRRGRNRRSLLNKERRRRKRGRGLKQRRENAWPWRLKSRDSVWTIIRSVSVSVHWNQFS